MTQGVALAHDYATQRGGAERVALLLAEAFPGSPMYTTLYDPDGTFPEFGALDLRTSALDRSRLLRRHHRAALPFLAPAVDRQRVDADVLLASSTGWAHGYRGARRTVVYCHAPARWLYQTGRYAGRSDSGRARAAAVKTAIGMLGPRLREWDQRAARSAHRYLVNSTVIKRAVAEVYGIEAEVLFPPPAPLDSDGEARPLPGIEEPFVLCVARLLPYKNVDVVIEAAAAAGTPVVVVGDGPDRRRLEGLAARTGAAHLVGRVSDAELRWLYASCVGLVAASFEDFGLSPLEAAAFGKPTAALHDGGYLDTVVAGRTGVFFETPDAPSVADAIQRMVVGQWSAETIMQHADAFSEARFAARLREIVDEELSHR